MAVRLRSPALLALLALVVLSATVVVGPTAASPPPTPVCPTCGTFFEQTAANDGVDLEVERSVVDVQVRTDGSARWTIQTTLSESSAREYTAESLAPVIEDTVVHHPLFDTAAVEVGLDGNTLRVVYTQADAATSRTGVLLYDAFHRDTSRWWLVNAERLTIHAPDGHVLANDPGGIAGERAVTYEGDSSERYPDTSIPNGMFVAFTPDGTALSELRATLAIAAYELPGALADLVRYALLPAALLALATVAYPRLGVASVGPDVDVDQLAALTIGAVAIVVGGLLALGLVWFGVTLSTTVLAAGFGILATALAARYPATTSLRRLVEAGVLGLLAFAASNVIVTASGPTHTLASSLPPTGFAVLLAIPAVALLPLGYADATHSPYGRHLRVAIVASPVVLLASRVPVDGGMGAAFLLLLLTAYALGVGVLGLLPYWVGVKLASARAE